MFVYSISHKSNYSEVTVERGYVDTFVPFTDDQVSMFAMGAVSGTGANITGEAGVYADVPAPSGAGPDARHTVVYVNTF